jgi:rod shape-determining protein MreC
MKWQNVAALLLVFVVAVGGIFALSPRNTQKVQSVFLGVISPFLKTGSSLQRQFVALRQGLKSLDELERDNQQLRVQNKELSATNQTLRNLEEENNRLRRALEYRQRSIFRLIPARIIARDSSSWWNTIKVDRGTNDGIKSEMPVLTEDGLIGKTTVVAADACTILLVADENCKVAANVEGTREQGIVKGERTSTNATPQIGLSFLSKTANLKSGQKVYTSGFGGVYPAGVLVGVIKEFKVRELDGYASIVPAVDLTKLEDVFIVSGQK